LGEQAVQRPPLLKKLLFMGLQAAKSSSYAIGEQLAR
jgi:hypothetical protein